MMKDNPISMLSEKELKVLNAILEGNNSTEKICKSIGLTRIEVEKCLMFLENKKLIKREIKEFYKIELSDLGKKYLEVNLPEEKLLKLIKEKKEIDIVECSKVFSDKNEFNKAIGLLKKHNVIKIEEGKIKFINDSVELQEYINKIKNSLKKVFELSEQLLEKPEIENIELLKERGFVKIDSIKESFVELTDLALEHSKEIREHKEIIEKLNKDIILSGVWKDKQFRKYDVVSPVPKIYGGNFNHYREFLRKLKEIMTSLGFKEVEGDWIETAFWNFDVMFQPQDHPARELHDTFYLQGEGEVDELLAERVAQEHETVYNYTWDINIARKLVLRTHTTSVSFKSMYELTLKPPARYFSIGRVFRNEPIDATHLPEFYQLEGIVVDKNLTFKHLLGTLKQIFTEELGIEIKFRPHYFPYTEPSVEVLAYFEDLGKWVELGGAGMFRKEALRPLNINYPVLAFGLGIERMAMVKYGLTDIREVFGNYVNLELIRSYKVKLW